MKSISNLSFLTSRWQRLAPCPRLCPRSALFYGRSYATETKTQLKPTQSSKTSTTSSQQTESSSINWDEDPDLSISTFSELPFTNFGVNQHMIVDQEFKEALRQILWQFRAPIRYAFAYGSGVFPQTSQGPESQSQAKAPKAITKVQGGSGKMIDFIFGVSHTQHWHSLNLQQHRDHYAAIGRLGSYVVSKTQDSWGAGVYFNPFITVNGTLIKYGVVNIDTLCTDLSEWTTLYLAGRLHKPVKILRDDPRVRLANQVNLLSAVRTALLLLPESFTEKQLYSTIAGISYQGDVRMSLPAENMSKVDNIVNNQLPNFRRLYAPLIETLPNVSFVDPRALSPDFNFDSSVNANLQQDMDPMKRGNMVRRLPKAFRQKVYFAFQSRYQISRGEFNKMLEEAVDEDAKGIKRRQAGNFEVRVASENSEILVKEIGGAIKKTIGWSSTMQTIKNTLTAGVTRSWRYSMEKYAKWQEGQKAKADQVETSQTPKDPASKHEAESKPVDKTTGPESTKKTV